MTRRSIVILLSSILLAASVIASSIILIIEIQGTATSPSSILISGGLILISLLSVVFIYWAKIRKRPDEKKLDENYFREFEIIKDAIMSSQLPSSYKKTITEDVLELMLTAQSNGKSVQASIGDATSFAEGILNACISKPRSAVLGLIDGILAFLLFTLSVCTLLWLEDFSVGLFNQRIDVIMLLFFAVISFAIIPVIRLLALKKRAWAYLLPLAAGAAFIGMVELLRAFLYSSNIVQTLLDETVVMIPNPAVLIAYLLAVLILFVLRLSVRKLSKLK